MVGPVGGSCQLLADTNKPPAQQKLDTRIHADTYLDTAVWLSPFLRYPFVYCQLKSIVIVSLYIPAVVVAESNRCLIDTLQTFYM